MKNLLPMVITTFFNFPRSLLLRVMEKKEKRQKRTRQVTRNSHFIDEQMRGGKINDITCSSIAVVVGRSSVDALRKGEIIQFVAFIVFRSHENQIN